MGFFLRVDDFDEAYRRMIEKGVQFVTEPRMEPYGTVAVFVDISGNRWDLLGQVFPSGQLPTAACTSGPRSPRSGA